MSEIKANRTRNLRYKRPALATMGWQSIWDELDAIDADGCVSIPDGPGLGVTYDWDWIEGHTTGRFVFGTE